MALFLIFAYLATEMQEEIHAASAFLTRLVSSQLNPMQQDIFKASLSRLMMEKFHNHWDPSQPMRGNAYRSILVTQGFIDPVLLKAAAEAELNRVESRWFPSDMVIWIDPGEVTYRFGESGSIANVILNEELAISFARRTGSGISSSIPIKSLASNTMNSHSTSSSVAAVKPSPSAASPLSSSPVNASFSSPSVSEPNRILVH